MTTIEIILYIIIFISIVLLLLMQTYNKIKIYVLKINSADNEIDELLRKKYDIFNKISLEIKEIDKNNNINIELEQLKEKELSSFEFERNLKDIESKIYSFKTDNNKIKKDSSINDLWHNIVNINTKIDASKKYYNDNITKYNSIVSKFPTKIISIILRLKVKNYFDGKNLYDENIKDFKI